MRRRVRDRAGVALAVALVTLALVGALLAAAFFSVQEGVRVAGTAARAGHLRAIAWRAINEALASWDVVARARQGVGESATIAGAFDPRGSVHTTVTRMSSTLFWAESRAVDLRDSSLAAGVATAVRLEVPRPPEVAAVVTAGRVAGLDTSLISGQDQRAPSVPWCRASGRRIAAVVQGQSVPSVTSFGRYSLDEIASNAWEKEAHSAIIKPETNLYYATKSDGYLESAAASGLLIVRGRLYMSGPASFEGIIVAEGGLQVESGDVTVTGVILVPLAGDSAVVVRPGARLRAAWSSCAVGWAAALAGRPRTVPGAAELPLP